MKTTSHRGAYVTLRADDSIALVMKTRGPYLGCWDLPGGTLETGESSADAMVREAREELDIAINDHRFLGEETVCVRFRHGDGEEVELHHSGLLYEARLNACVPLRQGGDGEDTAEARWFFRDEARKLSLTPFAARALGFPEKRDFRIPTPNPS